MQNLEADFSTSGQIVQKLYEHHFTQLFFTIQIPLVTGTVARLVSRVAQVCETSFFFQLDCIQNKHTQKPESSFLELSDFFYRDTY